MEQEERRRYLIEALLKEDSRYRELEIPEEPESQKVLLRALFNLRPAGKSDTDFLQIQNEYLKQEIRSKGITSVEDLKERLPGIYLWQGDITTLSCDAIVNAANSAMTGCYVPNHHCIDNAIHTYSGVELRYACAQMMEEQGHEEPVGRAKITRAYNLPSRFILHTVGPIIDEEVKPTDRQQLASCYLSCLELAFAHAVESIAFCCISTGEYRFPHQEAAKIAVSTVREFLNKNSNVKKVIFNVFKDIDREIYERLLRYDG